MNYKTFKYKNYEDCYFSVGSYYYNKYSMAISILNTEGESITTVTVNMKDYFYSPYTATIKNYSENSGITNFLKKLGIIEEIYSQRQCNPYASDSETIDFCLINVDKLKEYSKEFNYDFE